MFPDVVALRSILPPQFIVEGKAETEVGIAGWEKALILIITKRRGKTAVIIFKYWHLFIFEDFIRRKIRNDKANLFTKIRIFFGKTNTAMKGI